MPLLRYVSRTALTLLLAAVTIIFGTSMAYAIDNSSNCAATHIVKSGETLGSILLGAGHKKLWCNDCAVARVSKLNSLGDANVLRIGQKIEIAKCERAMASETSNADVETASAPETVSASVAVPPTAPLSEPAPALSVEPSEKIKSELVFSMPFTTKSIEGTDRVTGSRGRLLTSVNPGVELGWRVQMTPKWQTEISSSLEFATIQPDQNNVNIEGREQKLAALDAVVRYGESIRVGLRVNSHDRFAYRAATGSGIRVQTLQSQGAGVEVDAVLAKYSSLTLSAAAAYGLILADSSQSGGANFNGRLRLRQDFESWALEADGGYESARYQTTLLDVSTNALWISWGIAWKL